MVLHRGTQVQLNQCLFGYDEGHRLLASSRRLPEEVATVLLLHSDLVPGLSAGSFKSYWTGVPVSPLKAYALMHTWPAPEMSRPGCVWTHVLLISFADMAKFSDLAILRNLYERPREPGAYSAYREPIVVNLAVSADERTVLNPHDGLRLLRTLYAFGAKGILNTVDPSIDNTIFAAWSQQWPRLRRSFSFRTARGATESKSSLNRFDLSFSRELTQEDESTEFDIAAWERVALDDLCHGPSDFRRFLWRYGSDQRRGRERFRFLAEIYEATRIPRLSGRALERVFSHVVAVLPDPSDGRLLKEDLVSTGDGNYSLLPPGEPLDVLEFFARGADQNALPEPPLVTLEIIQRAWSDQPRRILSIAELAVHQQSPVANDVVSRLAAVASPATFLAISKESSIVRERLVEANPALLDSPDLASIKQPELNALLNLAAEPSLAARLLKRLITVDDFAAARFLIRRFPNVVDGCVLEALGKSMVGQGPVVAQCWLDVVRSNAPASLAERLFRRVTSTSDMAACAVLFDWDPKIGLGVSSSAWAEKLVRVDDNVNGINRQQLLAYLLALALAGPSNGCEPLFERSFGPVHADIAASRLPLKVFEVLARYLPTPFWWQQWDTCLRLRHAVVNAYVQADLDPNSFSRLTSDPSLFARLVSVAEESKLGRRFIKRVDTLTWRKY